MKKYLLDTNIISFYFKGDERIKKQLVDKIDSTSISIITYYEIISGLQSIGASKRIRKFEEFCQLVEVINLDRGSVKASCRIYADLKISGCLIDDIDILIAGIAVSKDQVLVTDNIKHFERINKLKIENWKGENHEL